LFPLHGLHPLLRSARRLPRVCVENIRNVNYFLVRAPGA
jgi:hypothetical protein